MMPFYILRCRQQCEFKAQDQVKDKFGCQTLAPKEDKWRTYGKSKNKREKPYPIFTRYVFADFDVWPGVDRLREEADLLTGYVAFGGRPAILTPADVQFLRALNGEIPLPPAPWHKAVKAGDRLRVKDGPFYGFEASAEIVVADRIQGLVSLFGRLTTVWFSLADVEPV